MKSILSDLELIKDILVSNNQTLSVAESVTGGNIQALLASVPMAIDFYQGGITTYNIGQKVKHLGVEPIHAIKYNSVSGKVASELAIGAIKLFMSDFAIAVTGYVGPDENNDSDNPIAFISIARHSIEGISEVYNEKIEFELKERDEVQRYFAESAIRIFGQYLSKGD
ncbi:MAG: CinA family protein [Sporocytophaga sp.]|uniref:CinA family protein n=1 Tax=Sporocytophaga sp. TaxID=2231183 RepID=UPI001B00B289|nr:CinA family protein [Sporocytophaga sp.]MBO9702989.1 CinA family protein [Sporocytophaga sp.]